MICRQLFKDVITTPTEEKIELVVLVFVRQGLAQTEQLASNFN